MIANRPAGMPEPPPQQREMMRQMDATQDPKALAAQRRGNVGLRVIDDDLKKTRFQSWLSTAAATRPSGSNQ